MVGLIKASQLLLSLSIIVLIHEFGHFIAAKTFKARVSKFYLFFDPWFSLFKFKKGETEYGIGWVPLGGYVRIVGMVDESMDTEQLKQAPQPWEFRSKPAWQRLIIMIGGIVMNAILGVFIYSMILFAWGEEYIPNSNLTYGIAVDSTAAKIGFMNGDKIISVNGKPIEKYTEIYPDIVVNGAKTVEVKRNGENKTIPIADKDIKSILDEQSGPAFIIPRFPFKLDSVVDKAPAADAKLMKGDLIVGIDSSHMTFYDQIKPYLVSHANKTISLKIMRHNGPMAVNVNVASDGTIGVLPTDPTKFFSSKTTTYGFFASFPAGAEKAATTLSNYIKSFKLIFSSKIKGYKHLGGFISMGKAMSPRWDWFSFWQLTAYFSIIIGFMNFLPIPMLDGGYIIFVLFEMVTSIKVPDKFIEYANMVGIVLLLSLMVFANGSDVVRLFH